LAEGDACGGGFGPDDDVHPVRSRQGDATQAQGGDCRLIDDGCIGDVDTETTGCGFDGTDVGTAAEGGQ
jgi:hypothetical protein